MFNTALAHLRTDLRTYGVSGTMCDLECHDIATASKAYVAITLHDRLIGDRAA